MLVWLLALLTAAATAALAAVDLGELLLLLLLLMALEMLLLLLLLLLPLLLLGEVDPVTSETVVGMQLFSFPDLETISLLIPLSVKPLLLPALPLLLLLLRLLLLLLLLLLLQLPVGDALASSALAMQFCSTTGSSPDCRLMLQLLLLLS